MIKYRLAFTMPAETLFGLLAKLLPIEDLSVEELAPTPARLAKVKPVALSPPSPQKRARAINAKEGVNGAIMRVLADGKPHRYAELKLAVAAAGYAGSGIGSRLERLHAHQAIVRVGPGLWQKAAADDERKSA